MKNMKNQHSQRAIYHRPNAIRGRFSLPAALFLMSAVTQPIFLVCKAYSQGETSLSRTPTNQLVAQAWQKENSEEGIEIFTRSVPGSDFKEVKALATVNAKPEQIITLLREVDSHSAWVADCKESRSVGTKLSPNDTYEYNLIGIPWPFEDRDTVFRSKIRKLPGNEGYVAFLINMNDELVPQRKGIVRMKSFRGQWLLQNLGSGKTSVSFSAHFDPGGSLSSVFVNKTTAALQLKTLRNLREKLEKETIPVSEVPVPELSIVDPQPEK